MTNDDAPTASAVSLKLPEFYVDNPDVWFLYCDAQFQLRGITSDDTKFAHVILALPPQVATRVHGLLRSPPTADKYNTLKATLLEKYTLSLTERACALLDLPGLGDRKPSDLLTHMQSLYPEGQSMGFLGRELFLRQLPPDVRSHLADKQHLAMADLAKEADNFFTTAGSRICGVRAASAAPPAAAGTLCYYHETYKKKAKKCRAPCSYVPGN